VTHPFAQLKVSKRRSQPEQNVPAIDLAALTHHAGCANVSGPRLVRGVEEQVESDGFFARGELVAQTGQHLTRYGKVDQVEGLHKCIKFQLVRNILIFQLFPPTRPIHRRDKRCRKLQTYRVRREWGLTVHS
jgi:hypothetical protein